jgi:hypothetical protein
MPLADSFDAVRQDLNRLDGAVTYRQLADQLKAAIAVARANGLALVSYSDPTGLTTTKELATAAADLAFYERMAADEAGVFFSVGVGLR